MKNIIIITAIVAAFGLQSCAQKSNNNDKVPQEVETAFHSKFPFVKNPKWEKEYENEWEAEFKMDGKDYSASFNRDGLWMKTEYEIGESDLPQEVLSALQEAFSEYEIEEIERTESPEGRGYELEIESGEEEFDVTIDENGNLTREQEKEQDDED